MNVKIEKKTAYQIIRLTSESISESDISQIIDNVRHALTEGILCQLVSVETPLSSNIVMMGLVVICDKMIQRFGGHFGLIITPEYNESGLRALCDSLNVMIFDNEDEFIVSSAVVTAMHQEGVCVLKHHQSNFMDFPKDFNSHLHSANSPL